MYQHVCSRSKGAYVTGSMRVKYTGATHDKSFELLEMTLFHGENDRDGEEKLGETLFTCPK